VALDDLILRDGPACVWCGREPWRAGRQPRLDLLTAALRRLALSAAPEHAAYGARQLELLHRMG
jgi:hypothetical protein